MAGPKADKVTHRRRVEAVYRLILKGYEPEEIRQNTSSWGVTERQVARYIAAAEKRIEEAAKPEREKLLAEAFARLRLMRREAKTIKEELDILREEAALAGLYPAKRHELGGPDGGAIQHEHKGQVHGSVDHVAEVLATLAGVGAIRLPGDAGGDAAEIDELHTPPTDA